MTNGTYTAYKSEIAKAKKMVEKKFNKPVTFSWSDIDDYTLPEIGVRFYFESEDSELIMVYVEVNTADHRKSYATESIWVIIDTVLGVHMPVEEYVNAEKCKTWPSYSVDALDFKQYHTLIKTLDALNIEYEIIGHKIFANINQTELGNFVWQAFYLIQNEDIENAKPLDGN